MMAHKGGKGYKEGKMANKNGYHKSQAKQKRYRDDLFSDRLFQDDQYGSYNQNMDQFDDPTYMHSYPEPFKQQLEKLQESYYKRS